MDKEDFGHGCFLLVFEILASIVIPLFSGYLAWQWCSPHDFWGFIKFIVVWTIFGGIGKLVFGGVAGVIQSMFEN